jgi:hypothetical protein
MPTSPAAAKVVAMSRTLTALVALVVAVLVGAGVVALAGALLGDPPPRVDPIELDRPPATGIATTSTSTTTTTAPGVVPPPTVAPTTPGPPPRVDDDDGGSDDDDDVDDGDDGDDRDGDDDD